jgi:hypothetical protein
LQRDELQNSPQQSAADGQRGKSDCLANQSAHVEVMNSEIVEQPYGYQIIEDLIEDFLHVDQIQ